MDTTLTSFCDASSSQVAPTDAALINGHLAAMLGERCRFNGGTWQAHWPISVPYAVIPEGFIASVIYLLMCAEQCE